MTVIARQNALSDAEYYVYDNTGNRVRKVTERYGNGGTVARIEETIYLGTLEIKRITSGSNVVEERHSLRVMDDERAVATRIAWTRGTPPLGVKNPQIRYQLDNHQASSVMEVDSQGQVISSEEYFPYGGTALIAGRNASEVQLKQYRYSGKERDAISGLYYYGGRYCASWLGRWLSPDPAGAIDQLNLFEFVANNPVTKRDPTGFGTEDEDNLVNDVRFLLAKEFEANIETANKIFDEAYKNKKLFTDETATFSLELQEEIKDKFNKFSGAFSVLNPTLHKALIAAEATIATNTSDKARAKRAYEKLRSKIQKQLEKVFPNVDFSPLVGKKPFELHHILYKALHPEFATNVNNFAVASRGSTREGLIGTHEGLFHLLTSGNDRSIYKKEIAAVIGLFKTKIAQAAPSKEGKPFNMFNTIPSIYAISTEKPTQEVRSKSARILIKNAKAREKRDKITHENRLRLFQLNRKPSSTANQKRRQFA